jgi:PPOX class probable F420-dependent enzyme
MDLSHALTWAAAHKHATLITIRADGRAQSSDVVYHLIDDTFTISLTNDRAKTRNIRRDQRAVLHISEPAAWSYLSFDGTVELSDITTDPYDATADALVAYYRHVAGGDHDNWAAYRQAMIHEQRLIASFRPGNVVGQTNH